MARPLKWIFGIVGGLIVLVVIAVVIILSSYDFNDLKPVISKAVYDATGRELVIDSDIDLDIGLSPSLVLSDIKFQNADWGSRKEMVKVSRFEVKVALLPLIKGNIEVNRFILKDPDILIETDKQGKTNLEFKTAQKAPEAESKPEAAGQDEVTLPPLTINEFEIINATLTYKDGKTGKTEIVKLNNLKAAVQGLENPLTFSLTGAYNDGPFEVAGTLGSLKGINDPAIPWSIDITAKAFGTNSSIKGAIKNPKEQQGINLDFDIKVEDWDKLSGVTGQEIPVKDSLGVSGNITDPAPKSYQINNLRLSLGKNRIDGSMGMNLAGKVPFIDAALSSKELDLRTLMPEGKKAEESAAKTEKASKENEKIFTDDPLPLDSLKQVNAKLKVRFDRVILPQIVLDNLAVDTTMDKGNLSIKPFKAKMGGGDITLNTDLSSKADGADLSSVLNVQGIEIGDMLKQAGSKEVLEGNMNADVDIKGRGNSLAAIMGGLNGFSRIIVSEGKISNEFIDKLGGDFSKGVFRLLNPTNDRKEYTPIKCMVTRFDIKDGIADATAFVFNSSVMSVEGEGDINLKTERLNLSLTPSTKGGVAGYNLNIGELTQPFKLGGTLAKPSLVLDKQKAALSIGKAIGKDGLKGLLGKGTSESTDEDICAKALQAAETGVKQVAKKEASAKEETQQVTPEKLIEDVIKDPKKALKSLFGD